MTPDPLFDEGYYPATAGAAPPCPPLDGDATCDLVVVGAGFTGLAAALRAAEQSLSVIVLEAATPGHGASGRNGGQLIPGLRWDARTLIARLGRGRARDLFQLSLAARDRVWDRIAAHAIACDLTPGHATMAWSEAHYRDLAEEADCLARDYGYDDIALVPREEARATIVGSDLYHGGLVDKRGGHFHPLNYALGLARAGVAAGVRIHGATPATGWEAGSEGGVMVRTARGTVRAAHGLLAADTGMGSVDAARSAYAMPIMNYNVATAPLSADQAAALMPANMAVADTRFVLNYFRLSPDRRLIFGGGEKYLPGAPRDLDGFVRRHIAQVFPSLARVPITHRWGGAVGVSLHRLPLVGRRGAMFHAHGFSGHGAILTTLAGEAVADAIAGETAAFDMLAALPERRFPGGGALRWPLHVAGMLYYAARDRL